MLLQHPVSEVTWSLRLPASARLSLGTGIDPQCLALSDGVTFQVVVNDGSVPRTVYRRDVALALGTTTPVWQDAAVDLGPFSGKSIELIFSTGPGPAGNHDCDWAEWVGPLIVGKAP